MTVDETLLEVEAILDAEAKMEQDRAGASDEDYSWLPDWMLSQQTAMDAQAKKAKEQYEVRLAQIKARREAMYRRWGDLCRKEIDRQLEGSTRKSVDFSMGRAGYRTIPESQAVAIDDKETAAQDAMFKCPAAVRLDLSKTAIKKYLDQGGQIDGVHIETKPKHEVFFVGSDRLEDSNASDS